VQQSVVHIENFHPVMSCAINCGKTGLFAGISNSLDTLKVCTVQNHKSGWEINLMF